MSSSFRLRCWYAAMRTCMRRLQQSSARTCYMSSIVIDFTSLTIIHSGLERHTLLLQ